MSEIQCLECSGI